jgi:hypothetical protein
VHFGNPSGDAPRVTQQTLASRLERDRLLHRAHRIERVLAALQDRAVYRHAVVGTTPAPLQSAIADVRIELGRLRRRLSELPV